MNAARSHTRSNRLVISFSAVALFMTTASPVSAQTVQDLGPYVHQATLTPAGGAGTAFGSPVAVADDTVLVTGAEAVHVFERTPGTDLWQEGAPLTPTGPVAGFGRSLAFDGQTAIVGAQGVAYLFRRSGPDAWHEVAALVPNDEDAVPDFGRSVGVDGDHAIVGATGPPSWAGVVYIFSRGDSYPERWEATTRLTPTGGSPTAFGSAVDIDGDTAVVLAESLSPVMSLFVRGADGSGQWAFVRSERRGLPYAAAAVSGSAVVFASGESYTGASIYRQDLGGVNAWGREGGSLGALPWCPSGCVRGSATAAAISGDAAVFSTGAVSPAGFAHILARNQGGQNAWGRVSFIQPTSRDVGGPAVAISGDTVALGEPSDHVVVILVSDIDRDGLRDGIDACPRDPMNNVEGGCTRDSGAYLVLDDLISLGDVATETRGDEFHITATFTNTSERAIANPFFEVTDLSRGNVLVNADAGSGGPGATLSPDVGDGILSPGEPTTVTFVIGLATHEAFSFFVSVRGDAGP